MKSIILENPPLVEAICTFKFSGEQADWTIIERFYDKIKNNYPLRQDAKLIDGEESQEDSTGLIFLSPDRSKSISALPDSFSINVLKNYHSWISFKAEIENLLQCFCEEINPNAIEFVTLRYINRLTLPKEPMHYDEFLNIHPTLPGNRRDLVWIDWSQRVMLKNTETDSVTVIQTGTPPITSRQIGEQSSVFLDLAVFNMNDVKLEGISTWLEMAHQEIESVFLDSLTPVSRESIGYKDGENHETNQ